MYLIPANLHFEESEFVIGPQVPTGILQPTLISPARARVAVNDGFRLFLGTESQAGVFGHLSEIASERNAK
jgi:hypothetical protein